MDRYARDTIEYTLAYAIREFLSILCSSNRDFAQKVSLIMS